MNYPWYQAKKWNNLEQGDLLPNCPIITLPQLPKKLIKALPNERIPVETDFQKVDLIILSQSCDLVQEKIEQVLLCGYYPASRFAKDKRNTILKGRMPALHMIEKCEIAGFEFERQIITFQYIYTLPKTYILDYTKSLGRRIRLMPPYREHLSQTFARYFMRVGLPRDLREE